MPIPAGPMPTATVVRPNAGTVSRPVSGTGAPGEGADPALARARRAAERLMVDTCLIRRRTGETTDADGVVTKTYTQLYAGKCRFQQPNGQARATDAGEAYNLMLRLEVQLPMSATGFEPGDEVLPTASVDADLPGRVFLVRELAHKTHATARRLGLEEKTA